MRAPIWRHGGEEGVKGDRQSAGDQGCVRENPPYNLHNEKNFLKQKDRKTPSRASPPPPSPESPPPLHGRHWRSRRGRRPVPPSIKAVVQNACNIKGTRGKGHDGCPTKNWAETRQTNKRSQKISAELHDTRRAQVRRNKSTREPRESQHAKAPEELEHHVHKIRD